MTSWDVARLTARLGDYNIRTNAETMHIERKIKRVVRHRSFEMRTLVKKLLTTKSDTFLFDLVLINNLLCFSTTIYLSLR